ncbi:MAG: hypothetical protein LBH58_08910 [Tannerellaceae bacterium]|jgi:hypothetical protein|nr:hypothetical protein [Tannerellaceae bacterium]
MRRCIQIGFALLFLFLNQMAFSQQEINLYEGDIIPDVKLNIRRGIQ